jgi:hypothetical protein
MCRVMDELFIDGTVKCCPRYFCQLYTIHGLKNGNYVPLLKKKKGSNIGSSPQVPVVALYFSPPTLSKMESTTQNIC